MSSGFDERQTLTPEDTRALIQELELAQAVDVKALRERASTPVSADVIVRPGNVAARAAIAARGKVRALQHGGITCILDRPLLAGDVFHVSLSDPGFDFDSALVICQRCAMLDDVAFEIHFRFPPSGGLGSPGDEAAEGPPAG